MVKKSGITTFSVIIITVLITTVLVGGGMYFFQMNKNPESSNNVPQSTPTPKDLGLSLTDTDPTIAAENKSTGKIEGTFIFPSEEIPKTMKACAENIDSTEIICSGTLGETGYNNTFSFEVPAGKYYVYSQSGVEGQEETRAYYTEFVTCGLLASCPSHKKIVVNVKPDETESDIKPHDWYDPAYMTN